ncbi:hypothetical protein EFD55_18445 [Rhizobium pisi]|uniref:Uncharacterized protein n=1 Tax=Rhizobium pisi TaxID=574561 RepID=A0A3R9BX69_9HYPH|nr:hypothetical protein EFD55_18445 [Rhizobium pisi]
MGAMLIQGVVDFWGIRRKSGHSRIRFQKTIASRKSAIGDMFGGADFLAVSGGTKRFVEGLLGNVPVSRLYSLYIVYGAISKVTFGSGIIILPGLLRVGHAEDSLS